MYTCATTVKSNHVFTYDNVCNLRVNQIILMLLHIFEYAKFYMGFTQLCAYMVQYNLLLLLS